MTIKKLTVAAAIAVGIATCSLNQAMAAAPPARVKHRLRARNVKKLFLTATARKKTRVRLILATLAKNKSQTADVLMKSAAKSRRNQLALSAPEPENLTEKT